MFFNTSHGVRSSQRATSNSSTTSGHGSVATTNATNGGSAGRSEFGQPSHQGMAGGAPPGLYANGGYQSPAGMHGYPQNVPLPYDDQNISRSAGYGPTLGQEGELGRLTTLVAPQPPVCVPAQQLIAPALAGGYAPGAGSQYPLQNPAVGMNAQPTVNGSTPQSGYTYRTTTQQPHQANPAQYRREEEYRRQQGPSTYGRRPRHN